MGFQNKAVLVTGGSSGIGAAIAIQFSKEGANVAIVGRNETKLKTVAGKCEKYGKKPLVIKADVSKDDEVKVIVSKTIDAFNKLDVLVNNAGFGKLGSILDGKILEAYDEIMNTNVRAVINITSLAAPHLIRTKGNIINISSIAALTLPVIPQFLPYCVSKAALDHFTRGAALELAPSGVRVNSVNPGPVRTDFLENANFSPGASWDDFKDKTALNRIGNPEEIADLVLFLAGDKAKGITGSIFISDNGALLKLK